MYSSALKSPFVVLKVAYVAIVMRDERRTPAREVSSAEPRDSASALVTMAIICLSFIVTWVAWRSSRR